MPAGRPSDYSKELSERILIGIENGLSLSSVCRQKGMPDRTTVNRWRRNNEEFHLAYERAWQMGMEARVDDMFDRAEEATNENVQVVRLQCDNIKWLSARIAQGRFGDKQVMTHDSPSGFSFTLNPPKEVSNDGIDEQ